MKKRTVWYLVASLVVGLALLAVSCGGGTTKPAEEKKVTLESISVTPSTASIEVGQTKSYAATGTYSDGTAQLSAQVTWKSSNTTVATISSAGLATAVGAGTTTVTATLDTVSGTATLTVTTPPAAPAATPPKAPKALHEALFAATPPGCTGCHIVGGAGVGAPGGTGTPGPSSANDHTGRISDTCKTCHQLSS